MSFKSPEISIENAAEHKTRLTGDLAHFERRGQEMRMECDPILQKICALTDKAALSAVERSV